MATQTAVIAATDVAGYFAGVRAKLEQIRAETMAAAAEAMGNALEHAQEVARERIELSTTTTGERRAAAGEGFPGRIETGEYEDEFKIEHYQVNPDRLQGRVGWLDGGEEAHRAGGKSYFELQDDGTKSIAAVHALLDSTEIAKADFKKDLTDYVRTELS